MNKYYAHKLIDPNSKAWYSHIYPSKIQTKMCGDEEIVRLDIRLCKEGEQSDYWAWHNYRDGKFSMIFPDKKLVQMCTPDFFEASINRGEGNIVNVVVEEAEEV